MLFLRSYFLFVCLFECLRRLFVLTGAHATPDNLRIPVGTGWCVHGFLLTAHLVSMLAAASRPGPPGMVHSAGSCDTRDATPHIFHGHSQVGLTCFYFHLLGPLRFLLLPFCTDPMHMWCNFCLTYHRRLSPWSSILVTFLPCQTLVLSQP